MSRLFTPLRIRSVEFRNRVFVSPMCQYSSVDGLPTPWHHVHLGSRAVGGAGLVMIEATAVTPEGRISPADSGIWSDAHAEAFAPINAFMREQGSVPAIQLAHAGRKASTAPPWKGGRYVSPSDGGWLPVAPSPIPFMSDDPTPRELTASEIDDVVGHFRAAAARAGAAGFDVVELHAAHGYLLHQFLSPLTNQRTDQYGGSFENRIRLTLRVARAVREVWADTKPLFVRISASDWVEGGWNIDDSVVLAKELKAVGVDVIDCSSGGIVMGAKVALGPGYQVPFAEQVKRQAGIATIAVGLITEAGQAEEIVASGKADAVMLARAMLRDPYWPLHAAQKLGADVKWPDQYLRAK